MKPWHPEPEQPRRRPPIEPMEPEPTAFWRGMGWATTFFFILAMTAFFAQLGASILREIRTAPANAAAPIDGEDEPASP